jgi:hypothetical protein
MGQIYGCHLLLDVYKYIYIYIYIYINCVDFYKELGI